MAREVALHHLATQLDGGSDRTEAKGAYWQSPEQQGQRNYRYLRCG